MNGKIYSGFTIFETKRFRANKNLENYGYPASRYSVLGEAVYVPLENNGAVLMEINDDIGAADQLGVPTFGRYQNRHFDNLADWASRSVGKIRVEDGDLLPMLLFDDVADPKSMEVFDPKETKINTLGMIAFKQATIITTSEPVTEGLDKKLPWLSRDLPLYRLLHSGFRD